MDPKSGGPCQGIRNTAAAMAEVGVQTEVVCLDDPKASHIGSDFFPVHAVGPRKSPWGYAAGLIPWMKENIERFEAVIVHGLWLYHSFAVSKFMQQYPIDSGKKPLWFIFPHGMLDPYFQKAPDRRLKALRNEVYWRLFESKVIQSADAVLFTSEEEKLLAAKAFRSYHPKRTVNTGYGIVAPPSFSESMAIAFKERTEPLMGRPYFLYLSRIHSKKGLKNLIEAYATFAENPALPHLIVAGPGAETPYGQDLKVLVASNPHLKSRILFPGMLSGDAKWGAFYGCEAFVLPSHQENFGIAVAEALACGKPVLISDKVNIWREIDRGNAGIVRPDTFSGAVRMLSEWLSRSESQRLSMAEKAKTTYLDNFSVENHVDRLIPILSGNFDNGESHIV
jgi:glycosyltransferase involved in cell wall biosynthesis